MAKNQSSGDDRAKVKLRFYEFELEGASASVENSIRQITQAFTARNVVVQSRQPQINGKQPKELSAPDTEDQVEEDDLEGEDGVAGEDAAPSPKLKSPRKVSKPKVPTSIQGFDLTGTATPFKEFAASKKLGGHASRYLLAAYWLKEFGNSPTITADKVYTCYKAADWPTNIVDWDVNFRAQIKDDLFRRNNPGEYSITPKGENAVKELDAAE
jgi:hypothetical protein